LQKKLFQKRWLEDDSLLGRKKTVGKEGERKSKWAADWKCQLLYSMEEKCGDAGLGKQRNNIRRGKKVGIMKVQGGKFTREREMPGESKTTQKVGHPEPGDVSEASGGKALHCDKTQFKRKKSQPVRRHEVKGEKEKAGEFPKRKEV